MNQIQKVRLPVIQKSVPANLDTALELSRLPFLPPEVPEFDRSAIQIDEKRELRTSTYTIYVDLPGRDDEMLLVHGYTGAYDKVSRRVVAHLRSREPNKLHKPLHGEWSPETESPNVVDTLPDATIQKLKKRGYLTSLTVDEEESFFTKAASYRHLRAIHQSPSYIVMPTYECNLRCSYCFQDHMRTDPSYGHLLRVMQPEMVHRILQGMTQIETAHGIPTGATITRNITFFGGEPLLEQSKPIVELFINKLLDMGRANLAAITNGTELHAYRDLLGPGKINFLQITIDGPPAEHDRRRIYADGSGSFERIAKNIDMVLELGAKISLRMNIDRNNIKLLPDVGEEFEKRGWVNHPGFSAYVAPIHPQGEEPHPKTTFNSFELHQALRELQKEHAVTRKIGGPDDGLAERARVIFDKRVDPLPTFKSDFCSAHTTMYILDAFGDIYACWERTGDPSIRIGHIGDSGEVRMSRAILDSWRSRSVTSNPVCRKCRYASYCGGGCAVLAEGQNGSIHSNHCDGFAKRFRNSAATAYLDHIAGKIFEPNTERVCDL
jgi:uncharacterized protein